MCVFSLDGYKIHIQPEQSNRFQRMDRRTVPRTDTRNIYVSRAAVPY